MRKLIKLQFIIQKILGIKNTGVVSMHTSVSRMVRMHRRYMRVYGRAPDIFRKHHAKFRMEDPRFTAPFGEFYRLIYICTDLKAGRYSRTARKIGSRLPGGAGRIWRSCSFRVLYLILGFIDYYILPPFENTMQRTGFALPLWSFVSFLLLSWEDFSLIFLAVFYICTSSQIAVFFVLVISLAAFSSQVCYHCPMASWLIRVPFASSSVVCFPVPQ